MASGISKRRFYDLKNPSWKLEPSPPMLHRIAKGVGIPVEQLIILKTFDRIAFICGGKNNHKNFETMLKDFDPLLRKAVISRHKLFN